MSFPLTTGRLSLRGSFKPQDRLRGSYGTTGDVVASTPKAGIMRGS